MGTAAWMRRSHHAAVMAFLVATVAIVAAALVAAVGVAPAVTGGPSALHAVGTLATKSPAAKAWWTSSQPTEFDLVRLRQAARQGEVDVLGLELDARRYFVNFCDGPVTLNATCPCYFKPLVRSSVAGISLDVTLALTPKQPEGTTAAVLKAAKRSLAAAVIDGAPANEPDLFNPSILTFKAPNVIIREPVTVTVTATRRGGPNDRPTSGECSVQLNLILRPVEPVCPRLDISATGQGEVVGTPPSGLSRVSAAHPSIGGGGGGPLTRHLESPVAQPAPRVVGGTRLNDTAARAWVVQLFFKNGTEEVLGHCTGSLIGRRHVLTAAHCMLQAGDIVSFLPPLPLPMDDEAARLAARTNVTITEVTVFPDYQDGLFDYDIAVVRLAADAPTWLPPLDGYGDGGAPTPMPLVLVNHDEPLPVDDTGGRIAGFGAETQEWDASDDKERSVDVRFISSADCEATHRAIDEFLGLNETVGGAVAHTPELHVCAAVPDGGCDSCQGDSGGPIYQTLSLPTSDADGPLATVPVVVGVTNWGIGCALRGVPSVYTRVSTYAEWVDNIVGAYTGPPADNLPC